MFSVVDIATCRLTTKWGDAACDVFRFQSGREQLTLRFGDGLSTVADGVLTRIQSECLTGEVLGSMHCDCGGQLAQALKTISLSNDGGILIYLRGHEGRGIGIFDKIRAYERQTGLGEDTVDANVNLGLPIDARNYYEAISILRYYGVVSVRLMTNNPLKVMALEGGGITVSERVPHSASVDHPIAERYLETKRSRMGHN
ncbi:GTP cyclohydrolase II [Streptomyces sp. NPDC059466]|uniref:GTP cyclohydrolase II n=1 Tax=unclassified Streptomyces TaxID=2593676 RepID=UPI003697DAB8